MNRRIVLLLLAIAFFSAVALPQNADPGAAPVVKRTRDFDLIPPRRSEINNASENFVVGDVKGTVKTKAGYLAKPVYPDEARLAGLEGTVRVRISINEEGIVTSAETIEGDPALRAVAEDAARRTKFRIPRDTSGQAVKDEGVLVYSFEIRKAGWSWIAYRLSGLDKIPLSFFPIPVALKALPPEWTDERQMLKKLDDIRSSEPDFPTRPTFVRMTPAQMRLPNGMMAESSSIHGKLAVPSIRPEQVTISRELISALKVRLAADKLSTWQFDLGVNLNKAFQPDRFHFDRTNAAEIIRGFIENRPEGVLPEVLTELQSLEANLRQNKISRESVEAILSKSLIEIFKSR